MDQIKYITDAVMYNDEIQEIMKYSKMEESFFCKVGDQIRKVRPDGYCKDLGTIWDFKFVKDCIEYAFSYEMYKYDWHMQENCSES